MNTFAAALLTLSMFGAASSALAGDPLPTPVKGGSGTINFTGSINNDACSVEGAGANKTIAVEMGEVSIKDMGTATAPKGTGKLSAEDFEMNITCNEAVSVSMIFEPTKGTGSGLVDGTNVLKLIDRTNGAKNIGIALLDVDGALINLRTPGSAKISSGLQNNSATLKFSAAYVTTGDVALAKPGRGDATLPFTLQYQ